MEGGVRTEIDGLPESPSADAGTHIPRSPVVSCDSALELLRFYLPRWRTDVHTANGSAEDYPIRLTLVIDEDGTYAELAYQHPKIEAREISSGAAPTPGEAIIEALVAARDMGSRVAAPVADDAPGRDA